VGWNNVAYPPGQVSISSTKYSNMFLDGDSLSFTLSASTAISYQVRDYYGTVVASGAVVGTTLVLSPLPRGWYKLYLFQSGSVATYGSLIGTTMFSVLPVDARLISLPAPGTQTAQGIDFTGTDHALRGFAVMGPHRNQIADAANPNQAGGTNVGNIVNAQADRAYQRTYYESNADSARPRPTFLQFPNGGYQDVAHTNGVTAVVAALYPDIGYFEGPINEPDLRTTTWAASTQSFYNAVKAGNASAKVLAPNPVTVNGGASGWPALETFLQNGGAAYLDAVSFHAYNCVDGDLVLGRRSMEQFKKLLAAYGLGGAELWQTEWGQFAATYGVFKPRQQCRWWAMHRFVMEQYGVPKERDYWFYDTSHGFWDFPSFWKFGDNTVTPLIAMMRVYSQELWGKTYTAALDFGTVENDHYIGSRFTAASDGTSVLTLLSNGRTDGQVTLLASGATPDQRLTYVDCFGNTSTLGADGAVRVPVTAEPCYVRVPAGITVTVEAVAYGPNVAREGTRNTAQGTVDPRSITNGVRENSYYGNVNNVLMSPLEFRDDHALPATLTVELYHDNDNAIRARRIDTVVIDCPSPWQSQGSLLDFDVEYRDTVGVWHTVATIVEPTNTFASATNQSQAGCTFDSFHSGRSIFTAEFSPVVAQAIRLTVRDATSGGEATAAAEAAGGQGNANRVIRLREIGAFCKSTQGES
jgi:hypothetical protein